MTDKKMEEELERVSCIWYSVTFKDRTEALLDSRSKVNAMSQAFATAARPLDPLVVCWSSEDQRHYSGDLRDGSLHLFSIG